MKNKEGKKISAINKDIIQWVVVGFILTMTTIMLFFLNFLPKWQETNKMTEEAKTREKQLAGLERKLALLDDFSQTFGGSDVLDVALPQSKDISLMLAAIRGAADSQGVLVIGYKTNPGDVEVSEEAQGKIGQMTLELTVTGLPENLLGFLTAMNSSQPIMKVDKVDISLDKLAQVTQTTMNMEVIGYYLPLNVEVNPLGILPEISEDNLAVYEEVRRLIVPEIEVATGSGNIGNDNLFRL